MDANPTLSPLAQRLLQVHAQRPKQLFYAATEALGSMFPSSQLSQLDQAYEELSGAGLMEAAGPIVSYFGVPKRLYRVTNEGARMAQEPAA
jgi:hypothetical protein